MRTSINNNMFITLYKVPPGVSCFGLLRGPAARRRGSHFPLVCRSSGRQLDAFDVELGFQISVVSGDEFDVILTDRLALTVSGKRFHVPGVHLSQLAPRRFRQGRDEFFAKFDWPA